MPTKLVRDDHATMKCELCGLDANALCELEHSGMTIKLCLWCIRSMDSMLSQAINDLVLRRMKEQQGGAKPKC